MKMLEPSLREVLEKSLKDSYPGREIPCEAHYIKRDTSLERERDREHGACLHRQEKEKREIIILTFYNTAYKM